MDIADARAIRLTPVESVEIDKPENFNMSLKANYSSATQSEVH
jgi:hypothetical protein